MGKVKPDLAGAYVSKVGGVAYYIKDGVNYVRSLSKSGYKSNTPLQAGVKARFKSASQMAGQMKEIAKVGFPQRKRGLTPKNAWHSANKDCFRKTDEGIEIDFEKLQFSNGNLYPPEVTLTYDQESKTYTASYPEMPAESNCHPDDVVYVLLLDTEQLFTRLVSIGQRGEAGETASLTCGAALLWLIVLRPAQMAKWPAGHYIWIFPDWQSGDCLNEKSSARLFTSGVPEVFGTPLFLYS